jgi:NAD-dependent deacetylase
MSKRIVVLTGAGISAESGIMTFRDGGGLWENHRIEDVATPQGFARNPSLVQSFYNGRRQQLKSVTPNPAHIALAEFEKNYAGEFMLVTQNVDDLHERAGSQSVIHMHGELKRVRCQLSGQVFHHEDDITPEHQCPCCGAQSLRPHIVWFGEMPLYMDEITQALSRCDLFISIGTSGHVYPAAGFVELARQSGAETIEINLEPSQRADAFHQAIHGQASIEVPHFFRSLLQNS